MGANLSSSLDSLFSKMDNYVSTKTVVGEPMKVEGTILLPLIDVCFGVGAGSTEKKSDKAIESNNGAGGLGAKITPSAVIAIHDGNIQLINIKNQDSVNKIIDMVPGVISKVDSFIKSKTKEGQQAKEAADTFAKTVETKDKI